MTKKKLSDLLRQEAQKSLDEVNQAETPQANEHQATETQTSPDANPAASPPKSPNRRRSPKSTQASPANSGADNPEVTNSLETKATVSTAKEPQIESTPIAATIASEGSHPSNLQELQTLQDAAVAEIADLKGAIADLDIALKTAYQTESNLRQDLEKLASELQQQREHAQTLTAELEQANRDKAELEQTKQLILTLSENNIKITQELDALKRQSTVSKAGSNIQISEHRSSDRPSSSPNSSNYGLAGHGLANTELRKILEHPVQKEQSSTTFSDAEIGWVD